MQPSNFVIGGLAPFHDEGWKIFIGHAHLVKEAYLHPIQVPSGINLMATFSLSKCVNLLW
jgi:hypothetical protein